MNSEPAFPHRIPARTWIIWITIFGGIILLMLLRDKWESSGEPINQHRFEELLDAGLIVHATVWYDNQSALNKIDGTYRVESNAANDVPFRTDVRLTRRLEEKLFNLPQFEARQPNTMVMSIIWSVLPIVVIALLIWFFFIRQIKRAAKNSPSTPDLQARAGEQLNRFEKILDKWEDQTRRMDAVLERMERIK